MFYSDGISLHKIKEELKKDLVGKKINRIFKNNEYSISLHFGKLELLFSCMPDLPVCYITKNKEKPILEVASSLISNLRKYLMNAMLYDIEQLGFDRILVFHFSRINEIGEIKKYNIYFECTGKFSNIVFTDNENMIIDSLKKFSISENADRFLFNGEKYKRPKFEEKILPTDLTEEEFNKIKNANIKFSSVVEGIGKVLENNLSDFEQFKKILNSEITAKIFFKEDKLRLATVLDFSASEFETVQTFDSYNDLINYYVDYKYVNTSFKLLKARLVNVLNKKIKKYNNILSLIEKDIEKSKNMSKYKESADILASVMYSLKKGMTSVKAYDFYNNEEIEISLDPLLSPKENLDKIYKKYNKEKRSLENANRRKIEIQDEIFYVDSILLFIDKAKDVLELREIEEELIKEKYIKIVNKTKKKSQKKELKYGVIEFEDALILYGRNNVENDNLTFKIAKKEDYWFHVKDIPSSHVVVKASNLTDELILKAAELSAFYSRANIGDKVTVDYTQKRYLNKPNGAKLGFVIYTNFKSVVVVKKEVGL